LSVTILEKEALFSQTIGTPSIDLSHCSKNKFTFSPHLSQLDQVLKTAFPLNSIIYQSCLLALVAKKQNNKKAENSQIAENSKKTENSKIAD